MSELPTINSYSNVSNTALYNQAAQDYGNSYITLTGAAYDWKKTRDLINTYSSTKQEEKKMTEVKKSGYRMVQVFVVAPHKDLPSDVILLYADNKPRFTDATDEELFHELNVSTLLQIHNEKRITFKDKKASRSSDKEVYLEPIRIRDLTMVVSTVAEF